MSEGLAAIGVSWFRHGDTFIVWLCHRDSKGCGPQAMVLEERCHAAFLLLVICRIFLSHP